MNRRLFLQLIAGLSVSTVPFKIFADFKDKNLFDEENIPKEIIQELHQQYDDVYIELHKDVDVNTQSFKLNYYSDLKSETLPVLNTLTLKTILKTGPTMQCYIVRGNIEGKGQGQCKGRDKTFRLRRIQKAGRVFVFGYK